MAIKYSAGADSIGAVENPMVLKTGGHASGVYKFNTPDGGVQDGYFLNCSGSSQGGDFGWVLIARYQGGNNSGEPNNERLATSLRDNLDSVRGLSDVSIGGTSYWSADWGNYKPTEIRVMTYNNPSDILGSRGLDWIYKTGNYSNRGATLWEIMTNLDADDRNFYGTTEIENRGVIADKSGQRFISARDGRARWTNNIYQYHRVSDFLAGSHLCKPFGFTEPTADMWNPYGGSFDSKWTVSATDVDSGQDTDSSAMIGYDDNNWNHYDANTGNVADGSNRVDFNNTYCLTIWMR